MAGPRGADTSRGVAVGAAGWVLPQPPRGGRGGGVAEPDRGGGRGARASRAPCRRRRSVSATLGAAVRFRARVRIRDIDRIKAREREQLARELHDTVAHHVSGIAIQAQAGRAVAATHPERAVEALAPIEDAHTRPPPDLRANVGARRTFALTPAQAWDWVVPPAGVAVWLGEGVDRLPHQPKATYTTRDGAEGEIRGFEPGSHMRLTLSLIHISEPTRPA